MSAPPAERCGMLAFAAPLGVFPGVSLRAHALAPCVPRPRGPQTRRRRRDARPAAVTMAAFGQPPPPPDSRRGEEPPSGTDWEELLAEMDAGEARRWREQAEDPEEPDLLLTQAEEDGLFRNFPILQTIDEKLHEYVDDELELDPSSPAVFSSLWRRFRPLLPRPVALTLIGIASFASVTLTRHLVSTLRARMRPSELALLLVRIDAISTITLLGLLGPLILLASLARKPRHSDAPRRLSIIFAASALLQLPSASAMVCSGWPMAGFVAGAITRLASLPMALWMWSDLSQELLVMRVCERLWIARAFCAWRWLATLTVLLFGGLLRLAACFHPRKLPIREVFFSHAVALRVWAANRYPVALSLMADTGGLAFLGAFILFWCAFYMVYVTIFQTDFMRNRRHRQSASPFSYALVESGIYMPDEFTSAERSRLLSTAPKGTPPYFAPAAMLLKRPPSHAYVQTRIATNQTPRIFELLDEEDLLMKTKGMTRWYPPRTEFVPITEHLSEAERSLQARSTWARALEDGDGAQSFSDFFESVEDDAEYEFDPETEEWVFSENSKWRQGESSPGQVLADDEAVFDSSDTEEGPKSNVTTQNRLDPDAPGTLV